MASFNARAAAFVEAHRWRDRRCNRTFSRRPDLSSGPVMSVTHSAWSAWTAGGTAWA